jgi:hypothetical protein
MAERILRLEKENAELRAMLERAFNMSRRFHDLISDCVGEHPILFEARWKREVLEGKS